MMDGLNPVVYTRVHLYIFLYTFSTTLLYTIKDKSEVKKY